MEKKVEHKEIHVIIGRLLEYHKSFYCVLDNYILGVDQGQSLRKTEK